MSADTKASRRIPAPLALIFAANAATQFAIQAWLAYGFAKYVWELASPLPYFVPVALDIFAINLMAAAYKLREAKFRQRFYVWVLLGFVIGAQIGASEGFADHEEWSGWGRVASLVPAIFLAGSLHVLIMVARRQDHDGGGETGLSWFALRRAARAAARTIKAERKAASKTPVVVNIHPRVIQSTTAEILSGAAPRRTGGRTPNPVKADLIKRVIEGGEAAATVAKELGVDPRTAQLWVKAARTVTPGDPSAHGRDQ